MEKEPTTQSWSCASVPVVMDSILNLESIIFSPLILAPEDTGIIVTDSTMCPRPKKVSLVLFICEC